MSIVIMISIKSSILCLALCSLVYSADRHVPGDYPTIQAAINAAEDGDTVMVAPGRYTGDGNRDIRLWGKDIVVRSVSGPEVTVLDVEGTRHEPHRSFIAVDGEPPTCRIEGFTLRGGYLIGNTGGSNNGGGGAAVYVRNSSPTIAACIMEDNDSDTLLNVNVRDGNGGAVYVEGTSNMTITGCVMRNNIAGRRGGALFVGHEFTANIVMSSCVIDSNHAGNSGGGVYINRSMCSLMNTTLVRNSSVFTAGAIDAEFCELNVANCVFWKNTGGTPNFWVDQFSQVTVAYTSIASGALGGSGGMTWHEGNTTEDPLLDQATWAPLPGSPLIDAGDPESPIMKGATDAAGEDRVQFCRVDIGGYESLVPSDCNENEIPDHCEYLEGSGNDCNGDFRLDECRPPIIASMPPDLAIDARQPSTPQGTLRQGWDEITMTFCGNVSVVGAEDFIVESTFGSGPSVIGVEIIAEDKALITLESAIPLGECTLIKHRPSQTFVRLMHFPADINANHYSGVNDILVLIDNLNGVLNPPLPIWQCDTNRSGQCDPLDILRTIDLLAGADTYEPWSIVTYPNACPAIGF